MAISVNRIRERYRLAYGTTLNLKDRSISGLIRVVESEQDKGHLVEYDRPALEQIILDLCDALNPGRWPLNPVNRLRMLYRRRFRKPLKLDDISINHIIFLHKDSQESETDITESILKAMDALNVQWSA